MSATEVVLGMVLGGLVVAIVFPMRGVLWHILDQKKQIQALREQINPNPNTEPQHDS